MLGCVINNRPKATSRVGWILTRGGSGRWCWLHAVDPMSYNYYRYEREEEEEERRERIIINNNIIMIIIIINIMMIIYDK